MPYRGGVSSGSSGTFTRSETGAVTRTVTVKLREGPSVEDFGAAGDGSDDSTPFNRAIAALGTGGGVISLSAAAYALGAPLSGTGKNITFVGRLGRSTLTKLASGGYGSFCHSDLGVYEGYRFENIAFDGSRAAVIAAALAGYSFHFINAKSVTFSRCAFREIHNLFMQGCRNMLCEDSDFFGTRTGVMTAAAQDPTAVPTAMYGEGSILGAGNVQCAFRRNRFHFLQTGINGSATTTAKSRGLVIEGNDFRSDWWNAPYVTYRFTPTAYNTGTRVLTAAAADFVTDAHFNDFQVMSVPIAINTGASFTTLNGGNVGAGSAAFADARIGDVIETADGKRAEIVSVESSTSVWVAGWESVATFEPTPDPDGATAWRLRRYYSSICLRLSATTLQVYDTDFINVHTGEGLDAAGLSPIGISCREHAKAYYAGIHINAGQEDLRVLGNRFRGGWADQCSMFDSDSPQVIGNEFMYGQDEGVTCTRCERAVISLNTFRFCGTSAVFLGDAPQASVVGNTIHSWGLSNGNIRGAIENAGLGMVIANNVFSVEPGALYGGTSQYCINLDTHSSKRTVISGNVDRGAKVDTLYVDENAVPAAGDVTARDCLTISGAGAGNVDTGQGRKGTTTLTESSATALCDVAIANNTRVSGTLFYSIEADDGTEFQVRTGQIPFSAASKAGTITAAVGTAVETVAVSSGTLTVTITIATGTAKVTLKGNAVSSLTQTTLRAKWQISTPDTLGVTPL